MFKKIQAKKSLGQNFLMNKSKLRKIVAALDLKAGDTVVEIGPGHGELTLLMAKNSQFFPLRGIPHSGTISNFQIIAIEKDKKLAMDLRSKIYDLGLNKNVEIIEGDAIKILPELIKSSKFQASSFKVVGNIPYYITGHLLRIIGELKNKPSFVVLTIQKEVAQRIALRQAQGKHVMNLLAASVQFWAEPKIIDYISKRDFRPAPKVDSAIIKLTIKNFKFQVSSYKFQANYYDFIRILFKQPRKTIANNLTSNNKFPISKDKLLEKLAAVGVRPSDRPGALDLEQIIKLSTLF